MTLGSFAHIYIYLACSKEILKISERSTWKNVELKKKNIKKEKKKQRRKKENENKRGLNFGIGSKEYN